MQERDGLTDSNNILHQHTVWRAAWQKWFHIVFLLAAGVLTAAEAGLPACRFSGETWRICEVAAASLDVRSVWFKLFNAVFLQGCTAPSTDAASLPVEIADVSLMGAQCRLVEAGETEAYVYCGYYLLRLSLSQLHEPGHQRDSLSTLINSTFINTEEGKSGKTSCLWLSAH